MKDVCRDANIQAEDDTRRERSDSIHGDQQGLVKLNSNYCLEVQFTVSVFLLSPCLITSLPYSFERDATFLRDSTNRGKRPITYRCFWLLRLALCGLSSQLRCRSCAMSLELQYSNLLNIALNGHNVSAMMRAGWFVVYVKSRSTLHVVADVAGICGGIEPGFCMAAFNDMAFGNDEGAIMLAA